MIDNINAELDGRKARLLPGDEASAAPVLLDCPACGLEQANGDVCIGCGKVFV